MLDSITLWLLDSDPAVRWQVMRDLLGSPLSKVSGERAKVATEGLGAELLALQEPGGTWAGTAWNRGWNSTMHVLMLLRDLGLDPNCDQARRAVDRVRQFVTWKGCGPEECEGNAFFEGEVEPCINAQVAAAGAYFGQEVAGLIGRLLAEQLPDGGWNCAAADGSRRSSFNTTICVLEALLAYERMMGNGDRTRTVAAARLRGHEYLLERRLRRRRSTGELIERDRKGGSDWSHFAFPTWWHYDVLRGLDYLRDAGAVYDERLSDALDLLESKRTDGGLWLLDVSYAGVMPVKIDDGQGQSSRWNTLRALRILKWFERSQGRA